MCAASPLDFYHFWRMLLCFGRDELVTLAVDVDDLNLRVALQVLAQLGDVDIH